MGELDCKDLARLLQLNCMSADRISAGFGREFKMQSSIGLCGLTGFGDGGIAKTCAYWRGKLSYPYMAWGGQLGHAVPCPLSNALTRSINQRANLK
jgi:hypothetical protein